MTATAVILAAGFGTRLGATTEQTPKPLLDIAGRSVLDRLLDRVVGLEDLAQTIVVSNARFAPLFEEWAHSSTHASRLTVIDNGVTTVDRRRGAVADMSLGLDRAGARASQYLIVAGDNLIDEDLVPFQHRFGSHLDPLVLCRDLGDEVPPSTFGEVIVDGAGRITSFREKPPDPRSSLTATCTYLFPVDAIDDVRLYLANGGEPDSPGGFIAWLAARRTVRTAVLGDRYFDVGTPATLAAARAAFHSR